MCLLFFDHEIDDYVFSDSDFQTLELNTVFKLEGDTITEDGVSLGILSFGCNFTGNFIPVYQHLKGLV